MPEQNLISFLESQIAVENNIVSSISDSLKDIDNLPVKMALKGISMDSKKHAEMYKSAIFLLTASAPYLDDEKLDAQKELIKKHINLEEKLIKILEKKIPNVENLKVKLLLKAILQDERRHHQLLENLLETLIRGETVTEGDWWDAIWGDVPGLWT